MEYTLTSGPGFYRIVFPCEDGGDIVFEAQGVRSHTDGRVTGRVGITSNFNGSRRLSLFHGQLNLTALRSRTELARTLEKRLTPEGVVWDQLIEQAAQLVLEGEERGFEAERLTLTDKLEPEYLLDPLILEAVPSLFFAPGGSGKSYLNLYLALLLENGLDLDLEPARQVNVLYVDFETSRQETGRRCTLLAAGLRRRLSGQEIRLPRYGRGLGTLADRQADIARFVAEHDIGLLIVDSAGVAAGGDVLAAETAVRLFDAVRQITAPSNAAALISTHTTKADSEQSDSHRAPYGSVFFTNLARLTWEVRLQETARDDVLQVGLFCRKANAGRPDPLGFRFSFGTEAILVDRVAVHDLTTEQGAIRAMILSELGHGPAGPSELAEAIGTTASTISKTLTDLKNRGQVDNIGRGRWVLTEGGRA